MLEIVTKYQYDGEDFVYECILKDEETSVLIYSNELNIITKLGVKVTNGKVTVMRIPTRDIGSFVTAAFVDIPNMLKAHGLEDGNSYSRLITYDFTIFLKQNNYQLGAIPLIALKPYSTLGADIIKTQEFNMVVMNARLEVNFEELYRKILEDGNEVKDQSPDKTTTEHLEFICNDCKETKTIQQDKNNKPRNRYLCSCGGYFVNKGVLKRVRGE